ncbi:MAG TPA: hypothetical protein VN694_01950 [Caulobacteraceae bacterium]|nr:hypothetical protein [Caulobacteraceae bacterium]
MRFRTALSAAAAALVAAPATAQPPARTLEMNYSGLLNALHLTGEVKVLALHMVEQAGASHFDTRAEMQSYGILRAFKRIDIKTAADGPVQAGLPQQHTFDFLEGKKDGSWKRTLLVWEPTQVVSQPPHHPFGDPPPTQAQELAASDPLTQMSRIAYAASSGMICGHSWRFFDGVQLYEVQLGPGAAAPPTAHEKAIGVAEAVRCDAHYAEVAGFKHKKGEPKDTGIKSVITVRFGRIGAGGPWIGLAMKADTALGYAKIELDSVRLSPA